MDSVVILTQDIPTFLQGDSTSFPLYCYWDVLNLWLAPLLKPFPLSSRKKNKHWNLSYMFSLFFFLMCTILLEMGLQGQSWLSSLGKKIIKFSINL